MIMLRFICFGIFTLLYRRWVGKRNHYATVEVTQYRPQSTLPQTSSVEFKGMGWRKSQDASRQAAEPWIECDGMAYDFIHHTV